MRTTKILKILLAVTIVLTMVSLNSEAVFAAYESQPSLKHESETIYTGGLTKIIVENAGGNQIFYKSQNDNVAVVNASGYVFAERPGKTKIFVTVGDTVELTYKIEVKPIAAPQHNILFCTVGEADKLYFGTKFSQEFSEGDWDFGLNTDKAYLDITKDKVWKTFGYDINPISPGFARIWTDIRQKSDNVHTYDGPTLKTLVSGKYITITHSESVIPVFIYPDKSNRFVTGNTALYNAENGTFVFQYGKTYIIIRNAKLAKKLSKYVANGTNGVLNIPKSKFEKIMYSAVQKRALCTSDDPKIPIQEQIITEYIVDEPD